jgi:hypothetical protein
VLFPFFSSHVFDLPPPDAWIYDYSDFLESLDEGSFFTPPPSGLSPSLMSPPPYPNGSHHNPNMLQQHTFIVDSMSQQPNAMDPPPMPPEAPRPEPVRAVIAEATKTELFLMTAADQESGSRNERLNRVIRSKYEAGLLKPYNYVKGYARLSRWMDRKYATTTEPSQAY